MFFFPSDCHYGWNYNDNNNDENIGSPFSFCVKDTTMHPKAVVGMELHPSERSGRSMVVYRRYRLLSDEPNSPWAIFFSGMYLSHRSVVSCSTFERFIFSKIVRITVCNEISCYWMEATASFHLKREHLVHYLDSHSSKSKWFHFRFLIAASIDPMCSTLRFFKTLTNLLSAVNKKTGFIINK